MIASAVRSSSRRRPTRLPTARQRRSRSSPTINIETSGIVPAKSCGRMPDCPSRSPSIMSASTSISRCASTRSIRPAFATSNSNPAFSITGPTSSTPRQCAAPALRDSACITRSTPPATRTRSSPFWGQATFARWAWDSSTAPPRARLRSTPPTPKARNFRASSSFGSSGPPRAPRRSRSTRYLIRPARAAPTNSSCAPALTRWSTSGPSCFFAKTWRSLVSRR